MDFEYVFANQILEPMLSIQGGPEGEIRETPREE